MEKKIAEELLLTQKILQEHPSVKTYKNTSKIMEQTEEITEYIDTIKLAQKEIVHAKQYNKPEAKRKWEQKLQEAEAKLAAIPEVEAYQSALQEADELLQLTTQMITKKINGKE